MNTAGTFVFHKPVSPLKLEQQARQLAHFSRVIIHHGYNCPVYCWLSEGVLLLTTKAKPLSSRPHRIPKRIYALYMEYRNQAGKAEHLCQRFFSLNEALTWLDTQAGTCELPTICPIQTAALPIRGDDLPLDCPH
ncbi:hypothetical protein [Parendozoicomonas haliclonae]|uniref:Uncharacterized protein n=1 Tax=Parendozoicomonas haliclonae TaxID=1960125 RepID=A0A1X7AR34_9GAMM|nr:hypothetical protein [Parendozoicomonas haliclonae]SMA49867.1 hypothetical protein EHSB41UT_03657 [Parendozoicomonas haliclonae]